VTVSELSRQIRQLLESQIAQIWVEGEISNYRKQSSGHHYFTLKDERSQLSCVMFARSYGARSNIALADGSKVRAYGQVTVYEARGQYQLVVELIQSQGQGELQARFEALKLKLQQKGWFDVERKRPLPVFPRRVALITSPTSAAVQDMLNILQRRSPWLRILICPVRVQGTGAAIEIAEMIRYVSDNASQWEVDLAIVGRGGGSLEDLWEFNEEKVAEAIVGSKIPMVSAVGHEIDFTISDFVADLRAPTPSAAAELVAPDREGLISKITGLKNGLDRYVRQRIEVEKLHLRRLDATGLFREPKRILRERQQQVDLYESRLRQVVNQRVEGIKFELNRIRLLMGSYRPEQMVKNWRRELLELTRRLTVMTNNQMELKKRQLEGLQKSLGLLGPQQTLDRGYSITLDAEGHVIVSADQVSQGEVVSTQLAKGKVWSQMVKGDPAERESSGRASPGRPSHRGNG
jgi:exodeoxyribonuclease VII large subunit